MTQKKWDTRKSPTTRYTSDFLASRNFSEMQGLSSEYVTDRFNLQMSDMVWKVRLKNGSPCYLALLLEFQSTVCQDMAFRILKYSVNLLNDLKEKEKIPDAGPYPRILPIVIYNGNGRWNAATGMVELFGCRPGEDTEWLPVQSFFLIDENNLPEMQAEGGKSLAALWIRARRAETLAQLQQAVDALVAELDRPVFRENLWRVVLSCLNPFVNYKFGKPVNLGRVQEPQGYSMSIRKELEQLKAEAREEGIAEGTARGRAEGKAEGKARGMAEGKAEGMQVMLLDTLEYRFGRKIAGTLVERIRKISDTATLLNLSRSAGRIGKIEEFERLLAACD